MLIPFFQCKEFKIVQLEFNIATPLLDTTELRGYMAPVSHRHLEFTAKQDGLVASSIKGRDPSVHLAWQYTPSEFESCRIPRPKWKWGPLSTVTGSILKSYKYAYNFMFRIL